METRLRVRLTPGASRDEVQGFQGDVLRVRVSAPPREGRANEALVRVLAKALGVPPSRLTIIAGWTSRDKAVAVEGLDAADARRRLDPQASSLERRD